MGGGFFQSYEHADGTAFAAECSDEIADVAGFDVAAFDLDDDAFCFARIVVNKNLDAVDAFVRAFPARPPAERAAERELLSFS